MGTVRDGVLRSRSKCRRLGILWRCHVIEIRGASRGRGADVRKRSPTGSVTRVRSLKAASGDGRWRRYQPKMQSKRKEGQNTYPLGIGRACRGASRGASRARAGGRASQAGGR